jgi:hypothetical protein
VADHPKLILRRAESGIDLPTGDPTPTKKLNYLSEFLAYGTITIGHMDPVGGVAIASEGKHVYVTLRRNLGETLDQTIVRLDQAIGKVVTEFVYISTKSTLTRKIWSCPLARIVDTISRSNLRTRSPK